MKISKQDFDTLAFCAFRYALGRQTYVTGLVASTLILHKYDIDETTKQVIIRDIERAIKDDMAGADIDIVEWIALRNALLKGI